MTAPLERKRADTTLQTLLEAARKGLEEQKESLTRQRQEAEAKVKTVDRERFDDPGSVVWKFKLRRGQYKDYDPDKSAQVEAHYQAWVKAGKPSKGNLRRVIINIAPVDAPQGSAEPTNAPEQVARPRCKFGEKCYRKNPDHRNEVCHPGDWDWDAEPRTAAPPSVAGQQQLS